MGNYQYSIIITCFNKEKTILRAAESALAQGPNVEVIIVDDCSDDESQQALAKLSKETRLRQILHETNCGALASYLTGFRAATGKYLVMLDGDDILLPNILNSITDSSLLGLDVCMRMGMAPLNLDTDYREFKVERVAKKFAFIPGYLFAVTQNTGGTAYIFPKSIFEKSDTEWEQISIQDHILPGILSFYCRKFVKLKTVGYQFEPNYSNNSLGQQTHRKNCERILSDLQILKRAQDLKVNLVAQKLLKIAAFVRVRKYIKKYSIQLPDLSLRLCFENNEIFHNVCRNVALAIISQR